MVLQGGEILSHISTSESLRTSFRGDFSTMDNFYDDISTSPYVVCVQWSLHATSSSNVLPVRFLQHISEFNPPHPPTN